MRRVLRIAGVVIALAVVAGACDSPTKPSGNPNVLSAQLLAVAVVPPATGTETQGTGSATITLQLTRDAGGTITSAAVDFQVAVANLPAGTTLTEAHIHLGLPGVEGAVVVDTGLLQGEVTLAAGNGAFIKQNINIPATLGQELYSTPGNFYFDIHTVRNPSGVVRGQLSR